MENKTRFRNHWSIILEKLGVVNSILCVFLFTNIDMFQDMIEHGELERTRMIFIGSGLCILWFTTTLYQWILWRRTFITITSSSIIMERNTIMKKKNTIGIKNISNVNIQQGFFELLIGTCKVKMDTNSMTTADTTDISIVLKKQEGEQLRDQMLQLMQIAKDEVEREVTIDEFEKEKWDEQADIRELITHGLLSIKITALLAVGFGFIFLLTVLKDSVENWNQSGSFSGILVGILVSGGFFLSACRSIVKEFIQYYDFRIARREDKLYIRYGFLKKMNYTIPLEKINGLVLEQSVFARFFHMYKGRIINIGMGDEADEAESFLFPYCTKDVMEKRIAKLLPEFSHMIDLQYEKQSKYAWFSWSVSFVVYVALLFFVGTAVRYYFPEFSLWIAIVGIFLGSLVFLYLVSGYLTEGIRIGEAYLLLVNGEFVKSYCFIQCKNIQYVTLKQNPIAKRFHLQKGEAYLLASWKNRVKMIPYVDEHKIQVIEEKMR